MIIENMIVELMERYWANHELSLRDHFMLNQEYKPCSDTTRWSEALLAILFDGKCTVSQGGYSVDVRDCKVFCIGTTEGKVRSNIQPSKCPNCKTKHSPFDNLCKYCGTTLLRMTDSPISLSQTQYWNYRPDTYAYTCISWGDLGLVKPYADLPAKIVRKSFSGNDPALKIEMERLKKLNRKSSNTRKRALRTFNTTELLTIDITLSGNKCIVNSIKSSNEIIKQRLSQSF